MRKTLMGQPPDVDFVMVRDYAKPTFPDPDIFFRIHLDVPIKASDLTTLDKAISEDRFADAYLLLQRNYSEMLEKGPLAHAVIRAALGVTGAGAPIRRSKKSK